MAEATPTEMVEDIIQTASYETVEALIELLEGPSDKCVQFAALLQIEFNDFYDFDEDEDGD